MGAAGTPKTPEKKKKKKAPKEEEASATSAATTPLIPLSAEMKAKLEAAKARKREKKLRQKEKKMANEKDAVVVGANNATMIKSKKEPLAVKINALQEKFGKQKEKIRL